MFMFNCCSPLQNYDEENKIDFVIVWEEKHSDPLWSDKKYFDITCSNEDQS